MLEVNNITKRFGGIVAVNQISFEIKKKQIVGMIGPNGSGKTTIFNVITRTLDLDDGEIYLNGRRIDRLKTFQVARLSMGRTFQVIRLFQNLTLQENMTAAALISRSSDWKERISELLHLVGLVQHRHKFASNLSYGQQKLLSFAMALASDPDLVLLDEPVCGVNPVISEQLSGHIKQLRDEGKTFLVIEHNVPFVAALCDFLIVIDSGEKIAYGEPDSVIRDERVMEAYLGRG